MNRSIRSGLPVVALLGLGTLALALHGQAPPAKETQTTAVFTGKWILVEASKEVSATLEKAEIRAVGGRNFIVGLSAKDSSITKEHFPGARVWIPLENVLRIVEIEDIEPLKKRAGVKEAR